MDVSREITLEKQRSTSNLIKGVASTNFARARDIGATSSGGSGDSLAAEPNRQ